MPAKQKRKLDTLDDEDIVWHWQDGKKYLPHNSVDSALLESGFQQKAKLKSGSNKVWHTTGFSFNTEYKTQYVIDFAKMTQTNSESGTMRKLKRVLPTGQRLLSLEEEAKKPVTRARKVTKEATAPKGRGMKLVS